jgi:hypothetical protein
VVVVVDEHAGLGLAVVVVDRDAERLCGPLIDIRGERSPALDKRRSARFAGGWVPDARSDRYTVGAAVKLVTPQRDMTSKVASAENPPRSSTLGTPSARLAMTPRYSP